MAARLKATENELNATRLSPSTKQSKLTQFIKDQKSRQECEPVIVLHVEIVLKTKQPEVETSRVWRIHPGYQKRERKLNKWQEKKKRNKLVKHVKCKVVLQFICGLMKQG